MRWLVSVAVALVALRAALPELVELYVNRVLDRAQDYTGYVDDVDLALWRGAYTIEGLRLDHVRNEALRPLLSVERLDLSVRWSALLRGSLVGEVDARGLVYNVVAAPPEAEEALAQTGEEPALAERLTELFPFSLDRLALRDASLRYRDPHRSPRVDIALTDLRLLARNWSNVRDAKRRHFGRAWLRARSFDSGRIAASLEADPLASPPDFRLAARAEGIRLAELNDFLEAYGGFDVEEGLLSVYVEVEARDGRFDGYVKPIVSELDVLGDEERDDWLDQVWEASVGAMAELFENQETDRQATRIPIEGEWDDPATDLGSAVRAVLYNAFIEALLPGLENPAELVRSKRADDSS